MFLKLDIIKKLTALQIINNICHDFSLSSTEQFKLSMSQKRNEAAPNKRFVHKMRMMPQEKTNRLQAQLDPRCRENRSILRKNIPQKIVASATRQSVTIDNRPTGLLEMPRPRCCVEITDA